MPWQRLVSLWRELYEDVKKIRSRKSEDHLCVYLVVLMLGYVSGPDLSREAGLVSSSTDPQGKVIKCTDAPSCSTVTTGSSSLALMTKRCRFTARWS